MTFWSTSSTTRSKLTTIRWLSRHWLPITSSWFLIIAMIAPSSLCATRPLTRWSYWWKTGSTTNGTSYSRPITSDMRYYLNETIYESSLRVGVHHVRLNRSKRWAALIFFSNYFYIVLRFFYAFRLIRVRDSGFLKPHSSITRCSYSKRRRTGGASRRLIRGNSTVPRRLLSFREGWLPPLCRLVALSANLSLLIWGNLATYLTSWDLS